MDSTVLFDSDGNKKMTGDDSSLLPGVLEAHREISWAIRKSMTTTDSMQHAGVALLMSLWKNGETGMTELAGCMHVSKTRLTAITKDLESAGWVRRESDQIDERRKTVSLTDAGSSALSEFMIGLQTRMTAALADLPADDVKKYVETSAAIAEAIDADVAENGPVSLPLVLTGETRRESEKTC